MQSVARLSPSGQDVIPDFFSDEYHEKASAAISSVHGLTLSNFLPGYACDPLIREVFADELIPRSEQLVEDVRVYIQEVLTGLCEDACGAYPFLMNEIKTRLLDEFMNDTESKTKEAILNVCYPELGWTFTQNASYQTTLDEVETAVEVVRQTKAPTDPNLGSVGEVDATPSGVPGAFIKQISDCGSKSDANAVRDLQVGQRLESSNPWEGDVHVPLQSHPPFFAIDAFAIGERGRGKLSFNCIQTYHGNRLVKGRSVTRAFENLVDIDNQGPVKNGKHVRETRT